MKCLIVDDEPIARLGMKRLVGRHADLEIAAMLSSAEEAAEFLANNTVDLIFLDIRMQGMTGMEFAAHIPDPAMVIFTTAYSEYALESYEVDALDYLVKPIDPERFDRAVEKARSYRRMSVADGEVPPPAAVTPEHIVVKADRRFMRLRTSDILYVEGLKDYVILHLEGRKIVTRITIKGMEEQLPTAKFVRINKSYIVNLDAIDSFDSNDVYIGTQEIAIGATYRSRLLTRLLPPT